MAEYIEREAVIDEIEGATWYHISCQKNLVEGAACEADALYKATDIYNVIKSAPIADVQEIKHGEWIKMSNNPDDGNYYCSECHNCIDIATGRETPIDRDFFYCPHCGAKMEKGESLRQ